MKAVLAHQRVGIEQGRRWCVHLFGFDKNDEYVEVGFTCLPLWCHNQWLTNQSTLRVLAVGNIHLCIKLVGRNHMISVNVSYTCWSTWSKVLCLCLTLQPPAAACTASTGVSEQSRCTILPYTFVCWPSAGQSFPIPATCCGQLRKFSPLSQADRPCIHVSVRRRDDVQGVWTG